MRKTLLAITTFNQLKYTELCRKSIPEIDGLDIVFIDDNSTDNTVKHLNSLAFFYTKSKHYNIIEKDKGAGLTHSWNLAYKTFKEQDYNNLIISNNDVEFNESLKYMIEGLSLHPFVVPMSGRWKCGNSGKRQEVTTYHKRFIDWRPDTVQKCLPQLNNNVRYLPITWFHGFCFGFTKEISIAEFDDKHLFNPKNINVHQEEDLYRRLEKNNIRPHVCTGTYVHHYGSKTLPYLGQVDGQDSRQLLEWNRERLK